MAGSDGFLQTPAGWAIQRAARFPRTILVKVDEEPERKGRRGSRSAASFQRQVLNDMEAFGRHAFTGPVALDLHFVSERKNPPAIYSLAKHVLDVLGMAAPESTRPGRRSVLYKDDKQVRLLYVSHRQRWNSPGEPNGCTYLTARPVRDVIADLRLAEELRGGEYDGWDDYDRAESDPFWCPRILDDDPWFEDQGEPSGPYRKILAFLDDYTRYMRLERRQEEHLAVTDAVLTSALTMLLGKRNLPPRLRSHPEVSMRAGELEAMNRRTLLSGTLTLPLPGLPTAGGQGEQFRRMVRDQLEAFRRQWPLFRSLVVPVKVTFLVVPPEQGKDPGQHRADVPADRARGAQAAHRSALSVTRLHPRRWGSPTRGSAASVAVAQRAECDGLPSGPAPSLARRTILRRERCVWRWAALRHM
jgi:hypothetical protein